MKILNFGSCNIDYVYQLEHIVTDGETEQSVQMDIFPGGKGPGAALGPKNRMDRVRRHSWQTNKPTTTKALPA